MGRDPNEYPPYGIEPKYPVTSIFRSIQGEGHRHGEVTTFIRLAGCSVLNCSIRAECDEAPWKTKETLTVDDILLRVRQHSPRGIVCITGGEPTDHDLIPLIDGLRRAHFEIHLETSGARAVPGLTADWITVSPKTVDFARRTGHTLKVVVRPGQTWDDLWKYDIGTSFLHRCLQPLTMPDGTTNLAEVIALLHAWDNNDGRWALSTQAHKTWGLP
jgi:organic radical activating enzyme